MTKKFGTKAKMATARPSPRAPTKRMCFFFIVPAACVDSVVSCGLGLLLPHVMGFSIGASVGKDPPEGCGQVREHHLHCGQDGKVPKTEAKVSLQGKLACRNELSVQALQSADAAKPKEDKGAGLPLLSLLSLLGLYSGLLCAVDLRILHNSVRIRLDRAGWGRYWGQLCHGPGESEVCCARLGQSRAKCSPEPTGPMNRRMRRANAEGKTYAT